jgi:hypothetical protein
MKLALNFTFRYIDDVLSLNDSMFGDLVDHIYPIELKIKDTTDTDRTHFVPIGMLTVMRVLFHSS